MIGGDEDDADFGPSGLDEPPASFEPLAIPAMTDEELKYAYDRLSDLHVVRQPGWLQDLEQELRRRGLLSSN